MTSGIEPPLEVASSVEVTVSDEEEAPSSEGRGSVVTAVSGTVLVAGGTAEVGPVGDTPMGLGVGAVPAALPEVSGNGVWKPPLWATSPVVLPVAWLGGGTEAEAVPPGTSDWLPSEHAEVARMSAHVAIRRGLNSMEEMRFDFMEGNRCESDFPR